MALVRRLLKIIFIVCALKGSRNIIVVSVFVCWFCKSLMFVVRCIFVHLGTSVEPSDFFICKVLYVAYCGRGVSKWNQTLSRIITNSIQSQDKFMFCVFSSALGQYGGAVQVLDATPGKNTATTRLVC